MSDQVLAFELLVGGLLDTVVYARGPWQVGVLQLLTTGGQCWACGSFAFQIATRGEPWLRCSECGSMYRGRLG